MASYSSPEFGHTLEGDFLCIGTQLTDLIRPECPLDVPSRIAFSYLGGSLLNTHLLSLILGKHTTRLGLDDD